MRPRLSLFHVNILQPQGCAIASCLLYTFAEMNTGLNRSGVSKRDEGWVRVGRAIWSRLMEIWIGSVLAAFFLIRILESQTARRFLSGLEHHHLP